MGQFSDDAINEGVDGRAPATPFLSAYSDWSTEVTGGSYARQALALDAATGRIADNTDAESLDIPAATTVQFLGIETLVTGGSTYAKVPLGATKSLVGMAIDAAENGAPADTLWVPGHGFAQDDQVVFFAVDGSLPTGLTEGTIYWVIGTPTTNSFQVSTVQDGSAVDITAAGSFIISDIVPETFGAAGTLDVAAGALDLVGLA